MVRVLPQIGKAPVEASALPRHFKRHKVLVPLPFIHCAVERRSLIGRICVMVEGAIDYFDPERNRRWWRAFFDRAARRSGEFSPDERYYLYKAAHVQDLGTSDAKLHAVSQAFDTFCPQSAVDAVKRPYSASLTKTGKPLKTAMPFDTSLFRSLFNMTTHTSDTTLLSIFSYSLDGLRKLGVGCQTLLNVVSGRVEKAHAVEKKVTGIIAEGRKKSLQVESERHITALANELSTQAKRELGNGGTMLFKGGCGSSNQHMRQLIHQAFQQIQRSTIEKRFEGIDLAKCVTNGRSALEAHFKKSPASRGDTDEIARFLTEEYFPANLGDFEQTFRLSYRELIASQSIEEKRKAHEVIKGWEEGKTDKLKEYLTGLILDQCERSYGHLLSDGLLEKYFGECGDKVVEAVKKGCDYLSQEWREGLKGFFESGNLDGIPDDMRAWLPNAISNELARSVHKGIRKILTDDVFPAEVSRGFIDTFFGQLDGKTKLEEAFRKAFSELMQTTVVSNGFGRYNADFKALLNQMPPEVRAAFGQMGIDEPDVPIWYAISQQGDKAIVKVFHPAGDQVETTEYACNVARLTPGFFRQLIEFRVRPRIDEGISYSTEDVHTFLKRELIAKKTTLTVAPNGDAFDRFTPEQNVVFAVMKDQTRMDIAKDHLFDLRAQALADMHALCKKKPDEYTYLLEGAEGFAKEAKMRFEKKQISEAQLKTAFETFWDVSANPPEEKAQEASQSIWINAAAKEKILTLAASLGISVKHIQLIRRVIQAGFGADMGPVFDSAVQELLGNPHHLGKISEDDMIDVGAKIGGIETFNTAHSVLVAYVKNRIAKTESRLLKLALHTARLMLWGLKIFLSTVFPFVLKITPQVIKDLVYHLFLFFLSITLPLTVKALVAIFIKKENIEAIRNKAFDFERRRMRRGGFDFKLDANGNNHLQLFTWFRNESDIKTEEKAGMITSFQFKSLGLKFNVNPDDGRAYVDESKRDPNKEKKFGDYFIAQDQRLPKGMSTFSKFLVLENAKGKKRVVLAEDSLDATVSANLIRALTHQKSSPLLSLLFQGWSEQIFPSYRSETAYFVYDYNAVDGKLESYNPSAMTYLLFYSITQGEVKQAEELFKKLSVLAEQNKKLPTTLDPLLRRIQVYCMLQTDRRALFLGIKLAALREQYDLSGHASKNDRLAPEGDEEVWKWLEAFGLQTSLSRYQGMRHRLISEPISEFEEYQALKGLQRRFDDLREKFIDPFVKSKTVEELIGLSTPDWIGNKVKSWLPERFLSDINGKAYGLYDLQKVMLGRQSMAPGLQKRLAELEGVQYQAQNAIKARAAFSWIPRFLADNLADPLGKEPVLCDLPFESKETPFAFFGDIDDVCGLNALGNLNHLIAHPVGKVSAPLSDKLKVSAGNLAIKDLHEDFFSYYRLSRKSAGTSEQQAEFHETLNQVRDRDPIFVLLQHVAKQPNLYPTADKLSRALTKETLGLDKIPTQSLDPLPNEFTEEMLSKAYLQEHFYDLYALAHCEVKGEIVDQRRASFKKALAGVNRIDKTTVLLKDVMSRHPRHYPSARDLKYALQQETSWKELIKQMRSSITCNKLLHTLPLTAESMTPKMLSAHFLDYYRLAMDPSQTMFHAELNRIVGRFDPMTTFLLTALKIVSSEKGNFPSVKALEQAFDEANNKQDANLREQLLNLKKACQAPYKQRRFEKLTEALPPVTGGKIELLKVREGHMTAETIKQNYEIAFCLAKGFGAKKDVQAFQMQIGNLVGTSGDSQANLLVIALSLIAQNPGKYKHLSTTDQDQLIKLVKQKLQAAGSVDIARNLPASLLEGDATAKRISKSANGWFGLGTLPGLVTGAASMVWSIYTEDYKALSREAAEHASSWAARVLKVPVPLNNLLFAIETVSESASSAPQNLRALQAKALQEKGFKHDPAIILEVKKTDRAMSRDMHRLLNAHTEVRSDGRCSFSSPEDYFKVRQSLEERKKHLSKITQQQMEKILAYANHAPIDYSKDFSHRSTLVTADELMQIFVTGDEQALQRRTGLTDHQITMLITMLLTYHQLCTQRQFLNEWEQTLAGIDIDTFRFTLDDYTISRPWDQILTTDDLRRHLLNASITGNRTAVHTDQVAQTKLEAMRALYPELAARQWRQAAFTRQLIAAASAA